MLRVASLVGAVTSYSSAVGHDQNGRAFVEALARCAVRDHVARVDGRTGTSVILVTPDGERTMNTHLGVCRQYRPEYVPIEEIRSSKIFFTTGYIFDTPNQIQAIETAFDAARGAGVRIALDLADRFVMERSRGHLERQFELGIDLLFANAEESRALTGLDPPQRRARAVVAGEDRVGDRRRQRRLHRSRGRGASTCRRAGSRWSTPPAPATASTPGFLRGLVGGLAALRLRRAGDAARGRDHHASRREAGRRGDRGRALDELRGVGSKSRPISRARRTRARRRPDTIGAVRTEPRKPFGDRYLASMNRARPNPADDAPRARVAYDEKAIQTLDALSHIRLRTGMYIGRIGDGTHPDDGIYVLLKEIVDNAIDEFIMGAGRRIEITRDGKTVSVRDYGRGIPLGKVVECVSEINTGGKYNDDVFQFSVGLERRRHQGGQRALGRTSEVESFREGKFKRAIFSRGLKQMEKGGAEAKQRDGTFVEFSPDPEIFGEFDWNEELIEHRLRYYAFLNTGLTLIYNGALVPEQGRARRPPGRGAGRGAGALSGRAPQGQAARVRFTHTNTYGETY